MTKRKLFVAEKPSQATALIHLMNNNDLITLCGSIAGYKFDYQEITFKEAPYTKEEPRYKPYMSNRADSYYHYVYNKDGRTQNQLLDNYYLLQLDRSNNQKRMEHLREEFFSNFDEIVIFVDSDITGIRGIDFYFKFYFSFGDNWLEYFNERNIAVTYILSGSWSQDCMNKAFKERMNLIDSAYTKIKESYIKKDFFEYNYNLNSLLFFNDIFDFINMDIKNEDIVLTKNYIYSLFFFYNQSKSIDEMELLREMDDCNVGSYIARNEIIENLYKIGLIEKDKSFILGYSVKKEYNDDHKRPSKYEGKIVSEPIYRLKISENGKRFVECLHKKLRDPNLSTRLGKDILSEYEFLSSYEKVNGLSIEDFKDKYERYLYNVFSKQKRHLRKIKREQQ